MPATLFFLLIRAEQAYPRHAHSAPVFLIRKGGIPSSNLQCKRLTNYTVGGLAGFRREFRGPSAGRESATRLLGKAAKPGSTEARCPCQKAGLRQDADHDLLTRCPLRNSVVNQCLLTSYPTRRTVVARAAPGSLSRHNGSASVRGIISVEVRTPQRLQAKRRTWKLDGRFWQKSIDFRRAITAVLLESNETCYSAS